MVCDCLPCEPCKLCERMPSVLVCNKATVRAIAQIYSKCCGVDAEISDSPWLGIKQQKMHKCWPNLANTAPQQPIAPSRIF